MKNIFYAAILVILLTACSSGTPALESNPTISSSTDGESATGATPTTTILIPEILSTPVTELVRINGEGPTYSQPITLTEDTMIRLNWKNSGSEKFVITIYNMDPYETDPSYKEPSLELPYYASEGVVEYFLVAGKYEILVDNTGGNWEVWLETATIPELEN